MTMGLKSRMLIGGMVKAKIMYHQFFSSKSFWIWWLAIVVSVSGRLFHGFEASLQRSQRSTGL